LTEVVSQAGRMVEHMPKDDFFQTVDFPH
jgi:hypothetical protein